VLACRAGYVSIDAPQADFVFAALRLIHLAVPDLARLAARSARLWGLSPQLTRLLHYNLWGYSDRDIADALSISLKTTQQYQEELRRKTGVKTKQAYLRRMLTLAGQEPLLPMTDQTRVWIEHDRALMRNGRGRES
jgi:DNA-binding CsgD family transcriptional regulator